MGDILAVTGHRPNKIYAYPACYQKPVFNALVGIIEEWLDTVTGIDKGITGMAIGLDQACAQAFINKSIPFTAALPFKGQEAKWPRESQIYYYELLAKAAEVVEVSSPPYSNYKMQVRNVWMMDRGTKILTLWDGVEDGGTWNAIKYAKSIGKEFDHNLWDRWLEVRKTIPKSFVF